MKKILFLVQLPPPIHGASYMNSLLVSSQLIRNGFDCYVLPLHFAKGMGDLGKFSLRKVVYLIASVLRLVFVCLTFRPDLIYFTLTPVGGSFYRDSFSFVPVMKFFRSIFGSKMVFHLRGKGISKQISKSKWRLRLYKWVLEDVHIIQHSPLLFYDIERIVIKNKVFFVPNGIPLVKHEEIERPYRSQVNILFLSNMIVSKGPIVLLEACKILLDEGHSNFKCHFVGDWWKDKCRELFYRRLGDDKRLAQVVVYHGPKYGEEKYRILEESDILCFPTYHEAFGNVIIEAMQFSLPVISTYEGSIPETIINGVTGYLVPQGDSRGLARKIKTLIENKNLRISMGKAGRRRFLEHYTIEVFETNMKKVLEAVVEK